MQILLVDDEIEMAEALGRALTREGHTVQLASTGSEGSQLAQQSTYDLLILDWMLPQQSGLEICQLLRSRGDTTPILFLTAKDTLDDRVLGLDAGADDYLVKPFELRELLARVRALLRRPAVLDVPSPAPESGRFGAGCGKPGGLPTGSSDRPVRKRSSTAGILHAPPQSTANPRPNLPASLGRHGEAS